MTTDHNIILIVDDNPINQTYFTAALRKDGFRVISATNGQAALEAACQHQFALILMDIRMPDMDGYQTVTALRNSEGPNRNTPVIAISAEALDSHRQHLFEGFLSKPVARQDLIDMVTRYATRQHPTAAADKPVQTSQISAINKTRGLETVGNDAHIAHHLQMMLCKELPGQLRRLKALNRAGDALGLRELLHRMMGSASFCGADLLGRELRSYSNTIKDTSASPNDWTTALERVEKAIADVLKELSG